MKKEFTAIAIITALAATLSAQCGEIIVHRENGEAQVWVQLDGCPQLQDEYLTVEWGCNPFVKCLQNVEHILPGDTLHLPDSYLSIRAAYGGIDTDGVNSWPYEIGWEKEDFVFKPERKVVYQNPNSGQFQLTFEGNYTKAKVRLTSLSCSGVFNKTFYGPGQATFNVTVPAFCPDGMYYLFVDYYFNDPCLTIYSERLKVIVER